jgi:Fic family protein
MAKTPCLPDELPPNLDWRATAKLVGRGNAAIARYDGMLQSLPNPAVLLSPITVNEAVLSSRIEGTQATLDQVLEFDAGLEGAERRRGDVEEVSNYRIAVQIAESALHERPLSLSLIKEVHQRLMQGVRGRDKAPGQFREDQNWIGRPGDPIDRARFVPPSPLTLPAALQAWESFVHSDAEDPVVQAAIAHAQFEILHPFKDGNGRIGRMLIPLLLYQRRALSAPMFYLSEYLEAHREEYYDRLLAITEAGDWQGWMDFFIGAVVVQAEVNFTKARSIQDLYQQMRTAFAEVTKSPNAHRAVDAFFRRPIIAAPTFFADGEFNNRVTANNILQRLVEARLIERIREGSGQRPSVYALTRLIEIADGR